MKNILIKKRRGAATLEWLILFPLIVISFIFILYMFFISVSYIQYNNLANVIAQDMNMRQSGYEVTKDDEPYIVFEESPESIYVYDETTPYDEIRQFIHGSDYTVPEIETSITTNSNDDFLRSAYYTINKNKSRLYIPACQIKEIQVNATKNGAPAEKFEDVSMAGTIIEVNIIYRCLGFDFSVQGYNVIT